MSASNDGLSLTVTEDQSNTLYSERYGQTYHSTHGAVTESRYVFLHGSGVVRRLQAGLPTRILEIGFGPGLNCLLSADCAESHNTLLEYVAVEHTPVQAPLFRQLHFSDWLSCKAIAEDLGRALETGAENAQIHAALGQHTALDMIIGDACGDDFRQYLQTQTKFDAIYLDAFSPDANPECWTATFLSMLAASLATDGELATYSVKGSVRRNLLQAGFEVFKMPGPPGKREVLNAKLRE